VRQPRNGCQKTRKETGSGGAKETASWNEERDGENYGGGRPSALLCPLTREIKGGNRGKKRPKEGQKRKTQQTTDSW